MGVSPGEITLLLLKWQQGSAQAFEELMPIVYPHLRRIASAYVRDGGQPGALQATALVHELYLRLVNQNKASWTDHAHFYAFSAKVMRLILIDHARTMLSQKRGGKLLHIPLNEQLPWVGVGTESMLDLNAALDELRDLDPAKVQLVELRFFLGCTIEETAKVLGVSNATVNRELKFVRGWLFERIYSSKHRSPENT